MAPIRILVVDPTAHGRDRLSEALGHRFHVHAVDGRQSAIAQLQKGPGFRLILVSSHQLEWKGKQVARHLRKKVGAAGPSIWHYGEVDGCTKVSDALAKEYQKEYGIDRFLAGTLAPVEIARSVIAHFRDELMKVERASGSELPKHEVRSARRETSLDDANWGDVLHSEVSLDTMKKALTKDVVAPIDVLPDNPTWSDLLRARVSARTLWKALNTPMLIRPVDELQETATMAEVLRARVNAKNVRRMFTVQVRLTSAA